MLILAVATLLTTAGCVTAQIEAPIVRPWEGHYTSEKAAIQAVQIMRLERGESVWLLSNSTLKRLLKTTKE